MVEWKKLGDICEIKNGYTPSTKNHEFWDNGDIPWFTLEDIRKNGRVLFDSFKHITSKGIKKSGLFPKDSIIISTTATIGEYALIKSQFLCNQQITCLSIKDNQKSQLDYKYLYYLSNGIGKWCQKNVNGGGSLLIVSTSKLNNLQIPIPPLYEQTRIVGILDTFTASIDNLKEQIAQRRKQYEYYRDQLLDLEGKDGVEMKTLGECVVLITDGDHQPPPKSEEGIPFITISNIEKSSHKIDFTNSFYVPIDYYNSLKDDKKPRIGDVLYTVTGSYGIPVLIKDDIAFCFQRHIALIRPNIAIATSQYLFHWLRTVFAIKQGEEKASGGAQKTVSLNSLRGFRFYYPPLSEQSRIVSILDTFESCIANLEAQLKEREKQYEYYRNKLLTFEKAE